MEMSGTKKLQNSCIEYCCEKCDYKTVRKSSYDKHLTTPKHKTEISGTKKLQIKLQLHLNVKNVVKYIRPHLDYGNIPKFVMSQNQIQNQPKKSL